MNAVPTIISESLPGLIDRASQALASARTSAEVLEARDLARGAYDAAKSAGRIIKAKHAHTEVIEAVHRSQADALLIETFAKARLADAYDAAQKNGEVAKGRPRQTIPGENTLPMATTAEIGLTAKEIHEARQLRDAEQAQPGITEAALQVALKAHREPTRAELRASVLAALDEGKKEKAAARKQKSKAKGGGAGGAKANPESKSVPDPERDRVLQFVGYCEGIAATTDVAQIAAYSSPVYFSTRDRMLLRADEAMTILKLFKEAANGKVE